MPQLLSGLPRGRVLSRAIDFPFSLERITPTLKALNRTVSPRIFLVTQEFNGNSFTGIATGFRTTAIAAA
ncbi:hypothetical protein [Terriglobus sp. ADX1]|uniref:hypothetical protein n=1 Tax=Terriglobus sp. ADX1 TaxID=2794063 RepID=UPI002FE6C1FA